MRWSPPISTGTYALVKAMLRSTRRRGSCTSGSAAEYGARRARRPGHRAGRGQARRDVRGDQAGRHAGWSAPPRRPGSTPWCCGSSTRSVPARRPPACRAALAAELRRALAHGTDVRLGPLDAVRDFVDARDVADAVLAAATARAAAASGAQHGQRPGRAGPGDGPALVAASGYPARRARGRGGPAELAGHTLAAGRHQPRQRRPGLAAAPRSRGLAGRPVGGDRMSPTRRR